MDGAGQMRCDECSRERPVARVELRTHVGFIVASTHSYRERTLCGVCRRREVVARNLLTLFVGWWSPASVFLAPFTLVSNVLQLRVPLTLLAPADVAAPVAPASGETGPAHGRPPQTAPTPRSTLDPLLVLKSWLWIDAVEEYRIHAATPAVRRVAGVALGIMVLAALGVVAARQGWEDATAVYALGLAPGFIGLGLLGVIVVVVANAVLGAGRVGGLLPTGRRWGRTATFLALLVPAAAGYGARAQRVRLQDARAATLASFLRGRVHRLDAWNGYGGRPLATPRDVEVGPAEDALADDATPGRWVAFEQVLAPGSDCAHGHGLVARTGDPHLDLTDLLLRPERRSRGVGDVRWVAFVLRRRVTGAFAEARRTPLVDRADVRIVDARTGEVVAHGTTEAFPERSIAGSRDGTLTAEDEAELVEDCLEQCEDPAPVAPSRGPNVDGA